ncbi:hypothetical protein KR054_002822 [Drosophila jambulina]|nr:hypothetical protein KR054_002822 [Drosophila jambulina]
MNRILNGLLGRRPTLARGFATPPTVNMQFSFVHPEKRRTFPAVYYNWNDMPMRLARERAQNAEMGPEVVVTSGDNPRRRKGCIRNLIHNRGSSIFTNMQKWSELRRKIIYGVY